MSWLDTSTMQSGASERSFYSLAEGEDRTECKRLEEQDSTHAPALNSA